MNVSAAKVHKRNKPCKHFPFARLVNLKIKLIPYSASNNPNSYIVIYLVFPTTYSSYFFNWPPHSEHIF